MNISCEPSLITSFTLHSMLRGHSSIMGEPIFDAGDAVNEQALNLSVSLPQTMPQVSTFFSWSFVGTFIQKSPDSFISLCEYLDGLTDILRSGGFEQTTPHHAMVSIFAFLLSLLMQLTRTTGIG